MKIFLIGATKDVQALAEYLSAPVCTTYLHNDAFPSSHSLWCGPLGYLGHQTAMKTINEADVVIALGTRLSPFGTLPQYGFDYWPKNAKIIQVRPKLFQSLNSESLILNREFQNTVDSYHLDNGLS